MERWIEKVFSRRLDNKTQNSWIIKVVVIEYKTYKKQFKGAEILWKTEKELF